MLQYCYSLTVWKIFHNFELRSGHWKAEASSCRQILIIWHRGGRGVRGRVIAWPAYRDLFPAITVIVLPSGKKHVGSAVHVISFLSSSFFCRNVRIYFLWEMFARQLAHAWATAQLPRLSAKCLKIFLSLVSTVEKWPVELLQISQLCTFKTFQFA